MVGPDKDSPRSAEQNQVALELFANPPHVTRQLRMLGVQAISFNRRPDGHDPAGACRWDACQTEDSRFVTHLVQSGRVGFMFLCPPRLCEPLGGIQKSIIATIEAICQEVASKETPFCICTSATGILLKIASRILKNVHVTHVDLCMFGCERKRRVVLIHNVAPLHNLGVTCDGAHQHRPWTAEAPPEADPRWLPEKFCKSLCDIMTPLLTRARLPRRMPASLESTSKAASRWPALVPEFKAIVRAHSAEQRQNLPRSAFPLSVHLAARQAIQQPGGSDIMACTPGRKRTDLDGTTGPNGSRNTPTAPSLAPAGYAVSAPSGSEVDRFGAEPISAQVGHADSAPLWNECNGEGIYVGEKTQQTSTKSGPAATAPGLENSCEAGLMSGQTFAVPWSKQEFLEHALQCHHPCDTTCGCEQETLDNIRWIAKSDSAEVKKFRACQLKRMLQLEAECRADEKALTKACTRKWPPC